MQVAVRLPSSFGKLRCDSVHKNLLAVDSCMGREHGRRQTAFRSAIGTMSGTAAASARNVCVANSRFVP
jgi:hypothetical protein